MSAHLNAHRAGPAAPDAATSDKARGANAGQVRDRSAADAPDATDPAGRGQGKAFATLRASAALRGFTVERIEGDDGRAEYVVSRWAHTARCRSMQELEALLKRAGVSA